MAIYKLEDGTSSVDFSPIQGLNVIETRIREHTQNKQGQGGDYEWGNAEKYQIPLVNLTKTQADQLLTWWEDMEVLTFTPDQASSGATIQMIIDGVERPVNQWHHKFKSKYAGNLVLHEVSSQSFSSSQISTSKSKSCSSGSQSQSCNTFSSLSCSTILLGISRSSSQGVDDANVSSVSCSTGSGVETIENASCSTFSSSVQDTVITISSCSDSDSVSNFTSCSDSNSRSSSVGVLTITFTSQSCSLDPSSTSCSNSDGSQSCSNSAGGIS